MEKVKITLTIDEASDLWALVKNSSDTGNEEWDEKMKCIQEKIEKVI